jgi:hypothetical protein
MRRCTPQRSAGEADPISRPLTSVILAHDVFAGQRVAAGDCRLLCMGLFFDILVGASARAILVGCHAKTEPSMQTDQQHTQSASQPFHFDIRSALSWQLSARAQ